MNNTTRTPITAGYFRTWRDTAKDPAINKTSMDQLPHGLDIALVFPWDTPLDNPFWSRLQDTYVPALHARGTKVVISQGIETLLDDDMFPDTPAGHQAYVDMVFNTYIDRFNLDGLDIDHERHLTPAQLNKVLNIFALLKKRLGPQSGTGKLLIIDTNKDGTDALLSRTGDMIDYLFLQAYGRSPGSMDSTWNTFRSFLRPEQFMIGFSFYEELGADWNDVSADRNSGRAYDYARWQPKSGGVKGGVFSYAIDRDIPHHTNEIIAADFYVTRRLMEMMKA